MSVPGWNDPPKFSHSSLDSHGIRQSKLNKRPTHPSPSSSLPTPSLSPLRPPPPPTNYSPPTTTALDETVSIETKEGEEVKVHEETGVSGVEETYSGVVDGFNSQLEKFKPTMTEREVEEVRRRLEVMRSQLESGSISSQVITKMVSLFKALDSGDIHKAQSIQVTLMVDHTSQVSQWMMGVKRLIRKAAADNKS